MLLLHWNIWDEDWDFWLAEGKICWFFSWNFFIDEQLVVKQSLVDKQWLLLTEHWSFFGVIIDGSNGTESFCMIFAGVGACCLFFCSSLPLLVLADDGSTNVSNPSNDVKSFPCGAFCCCSAAPSTSSLPDATEQGGR